MPIPTVTSLCCVSGDHLNNIDASCSRTSVLACQRPPCRRALIREDVGQCNSSGEGEARWAPAAGLGGYHRTHPSHLTRIRSSQRVADDGAPCPASPRLRVLVARDTSPACSTSQRLPPRCATQSDHGCTRAPVSKPAAIFLSFFVYKFPARSRMQSMPYETCRLVFAYVRA
jgi:hypothetical protein